MFSIIFHPLITAHYSQKLPTSTHPLSCHSLAPEITWRTCSSPDYLLPRALVQLCRAINKSLATFCFLDIYIIFLKQPGEIFIWELAERGLRGSFCSFRLFLLRTQILAPNGTIWGTSNLWQGRGPGKSCISVRPKAKPMHKK